MPKYLTARELLDQIIPTLTRAANAALRERNIELANYLDGIRADFHMIVAQPTESKVEEVKSNG